MKKSVLVTFILLIIVSLANGSITRAAGYEGYYSSEMILNLKGKPGDAVTESIRFFNDTPDSSNATFAVRDFIYEDKSIIYVEDRPVEFSVQKWAKVNVQETAVEKKSFVDLEVTVTIPEEAEMGEHMALLEGTFIPTKSADSQMKIATEISPVIYVLVTDKDGSVNLDKEWNLLGFKKDNVNGGHFTYTVENVGNVHLESQGTVKITNILTKNSTEYKIPRVNLLPNNKKEIVVSWDMDDPIGIYKASIDFSMDGERFDKQKVTLFVIPWILVGVIIGSIVVGIIVIRLYLNHLKKKWLAEAANASNPTNLSS